MSHSLASALTRSLKNVAVIVTATHGNEGMAKVYRAADMVPIATVVILEGEYELFTPSGQHGYSHLNGVVRAIKFSDRFPLTAKQTRNYSPIRWTEETI